MEYYAIVLCVMSVLTFCLYGRDKKKAKTHRRRTRESTLLFCGLLGGAAGALLGMRVWHHKTQKWYFWAVNLVGLAFQTAALFLTWTQMLTYPEQLC